MNRLVLSEPERKALLEELEPHLSPERLAFIGDMSEALALFKELLERKNLSLSRLRKMLFGASTEKTDQVCPPKDPPAKDKTKPKRKGHGRNPAGAYTGAKRQSVEHPELKIGDRCPKCDRGKLRRQPKPAPVIRVDAQAPVSAIVYEMEVLRCSLCGKTFTAPTPPEAGSRKYAPSVGVMVSLLRYGSGMPHYRLERLQHSLGVPLPAATQWELVEEAARIAEPAGEQLSALAAQAPALHNDDTTMRVGDLRRQIQAETDPERTGIFTTGIVAEAPERTIALFFTGRQHAGENLEQVLSQRSGGLPPPLQMCDGLSRNEPKEAATRKGGCWSHGRRGFVEVAGDFPEQSLEVLERVREIYRFDHQAKAREMDPEQRLRFHQRHSGPIMERLKGWLDEQIDQKRVEPNSGLGEAIEYLRRQWEPLTLFLREPGAPLDNNICERCLKMAILHRKNSLGYKTERGARVGDLFMGLIHTCRLNAVNPFDYLMALVGHPDQLKANPSQWLPWNYRATLASLAEQASLKN